MGNRINVMPYFGWEGEQIPLIPLGNSINVMSHIGWKTNHTLVGEENKSPFIRGGEQITIYKSVETFPRFRKAQRGQYLLAVGLGCYN